MGLKPTRIAGVLFSHDLKVVAIPERRGNTEDPGNVSGNLLPRASARG
jgi:hypothetical protein